MALDPLKQLQCLVNKTISCLENMYLAVVVPELFHEKGVLKNFAKFGKHLYWELQNLIKRNTDTVVVLWILRNFQEHVFCETPANGCSCILPG